MVINHLLCNNIDINKIALVTVTKAILYLELLNNTLKAKVTFL
jgi:hypothetical protein